jgi:hypothetical protein
MSYGNTAIWWQGKPFYLNGTIASNEPSKVVWEGDSIAYATFGCSYLYSRRPVVNLAVPGSTTADMAARSGAFDAEIADKAVAMVWGGPYNALATAPDTIAGGDAVADAFFAYMDARLLAGWGSGNTRIYMINMLRRGNSPPGYPQVAWAQCFARIAAEGALHSSGPALLVDPPGTPGDGRYYEGDQVHLWPAGYQWAHRNVTAPFLYSVRF